jgi:hypothetical protein
MSSVVISVIVLNIVAAWLVLSGERLDAKREAEKKKDAATAGGQLKSA